MCTSHLVGAISILVVWSGATSHPLRSRGGSDCAWLYGVETTYTKFQTANKSIHQQNSLIGCVRKCIEDRSKYYNYHQHDGHCSCLREASEPKMESGAYCGSISCTGKMISKQRLLNINTKFLSPSYLKGYTITLFQVGKNLSG